MASMGKKTITVSEAARWLEMRDSFLILTHRSPDGDTIGCAAALCRALRRKGKTAWVLYNPDITRTLAGYLEGTLAPEDFVPKHILSVDTAGEHLFPVNAQIYRGKVDLAFDHHASNECFAGETCLDAQKAACGELIYDLIRMWLPNIPPNIAEPLYVAIATDTGGFLYSNTTPETHRIVAALMETGIDVTPINKLHFRTKTYRRLRLESRLAETMEFLDEGRIALASLSLADRTELALTQEDLEDIAAFAGQLEGVCTSVTIREVAPEECRVSIRSGQDLNASEVCAHFGGGGHPAAAGCTIRKSLSEAKQAVIDAIRAVQAA